MKPSNLRDYYSQAQVIQLLGHPQRCPNMLRLGGRLFFPRAEINKIALSEATLSTYLATEAKITLMPAYDLDLTEWLPFGVAAKLIPNSVEAITGTHNAHDLLKPLHTKTVYGVRFYNKGDLLQLFGAAPRAYYNLPIGLVDTLPQAAGLTAVTARTLVAAWYSPKEARLVLPTVHRRDLLQFDDIYQFGNHRFIYHTAVEKLAHPNWQNRAAYIYAHRTYPTTTAWADWLALQAIQKVIPFNRTYIGRLPIKRLDFGGILGYNKAEVWAWLQANMHILPFPYTTRFGKRFNSEDDIDENCFV